MVKEIAQEFENTKFLPRVFLDAKTKLLTLVPPNDTEEFQSRFKIRIGNKTYVFDSDSDGEAEFFQQYVGTISYANYGISNYHGIELNVSYQKFRDSSTTTVTINAKGRAQISSILDVFSTSAKECHETFPGINPKSQPKIFIGHGRSPAWRDLKDHLTDQHAHEVVAYETGARAGHTIRDILDEMSTKANVAFLVLTPEDEMGDGKTQARPNVIHETGLFQGKLGFSRAIVLLEEGCEEFSNLAGIQQLRFSKGKIRETFGDVLATIKREFKAD